MSRVGRFDEIRAAFPALGFAIYAMEPGGHVTLEVYAPDGQTFSFEGQSEDAVLARAFPITEPAQEPVSPPEPPQSAFD